MDKELKECQEKNKTKSCLKCKKILKCEIRDRYVKEVYRSMNPTQEGGFEF